MPRQEQLSPREVGERGRRMFGELTYTAVEGGWCVVGRIRDVTELRKREPYRDVVVYGRARTFVEAFEQADRHVADRTPDEILDAIAGKPPRNLVIRS